MIDHEISQNFSGQQSPNYKEKVLIYNEIESIADSNSKPMGFQIGSRNRIRSKDR